MIVEGYAFLERTASALWEIQWERQCNSHFTADLSGLEESDEFGPEFALV